MKNISYSDVNITDGFWKTKQDINKNVTIPTVYERFKNTGRFDAIKCDWRDGEDNEGRVLGHIYYDSDVAKWIEGAAYALQKESNSEITKIIDDAISDIVKNCDENGYYNCHFLVTEKDMRFSNREDHELYCAGHLIESAVAYYEATGKRTFLDAMCRYADHIYDVFKVNKTAKFTTPGHPEIELALVKLYRSTNKAKYLELSKFFIDSRAEKSEVDSFYNNPSKSSDVRFKDVPRKNYLDKREKQDHKPVREFDSAEGHCVCCLYLLCAMADIAYETKDEELAQACRRCFSNIVNKKSYITGGVGSIRNGESFGEDYYLPNRTAYSETCAAVSMAFFAHRMLNLDIDSQYADCIERCMYNSIISGISLNGDAFFYENPLEINLKINNIQPALLPSFKDFRESVFSHAKTVRQELFSTSCCPPNIMRFIASIGNYIYSYSDDTVYVHQYINSTAQSGDIKIEQTTNYPASGKISIKCDTNGRKIALRIPGWCKNFEFDKDFKVQNGYAIFDSSCNEINVIFDMPVVLIRGNKNIHDSAGKIAVMRGPVVYCAEGVDNGSNIWSLKLDKNEKFELCESEFLLPTIHTTAYQYPDSEQLYSVATDNFEAVPLTLIPYFAFANRGESDMITWILEK